MDLKKLTDRAKGVVEKRGGSEGAKQDAGELADIAKGKGSLKDKARAAADAVKQPGAPGEPARRSPSRRPPARMRRAPGVAGQRRAAPPRRPSTALRSARAPVAQLDRAGDF